MRITARDLAHAFVSYRTTHRDLAIALSDAARKTGATVDTIETDLECPSPRGSQEEFVWLTKEFEKHIPSNTTFVMIASDNYQDSPWTLVEAVQGFTKAARLIVIWRSGQDPLKSILPLNTIAYRFVQSPLSFIVDARASDAVAVHGLLRILSPSPRYRLINRTYQVANVFLCLLLVLFPVTVLAVAALVPTASDWLTSILLRPWVGVIAVSAGFILIPIFYPSYTGPSLFDFQPVDKCIRKTMVGFAGRRWWTIRWPVAFFLACIVTNVDILHLTSMADIGATTYVVMAAISMLLFSARD